MQLQWMALGRVEPGLQAALRLLCRRQGQRAQIDLDRQVVAQGVALDRATQALDVNRAAVGGATDDAESFVFG